ncbi:valine--tRNA ligase-like [Galleria mellonella]|uniref:valine--tRNA ligase n=1 Tax=Galleria mellonella TaxID=7137 RepID=A0A6J1WI42_GALME|nr:valine--tRNA ligase-like [Galleria mellonella]
MLSVYRNYVVSHRNVNWRFICGSTSIVLKENLPATAYKPELVERNKYKKWEESDLFTPENSSRKPIFSMVLPPPNVTGKLHLGHALACTVQDVIVRRQRSLGHNVLWLPGTDHAGIATQGVVEKYLKSTQNINRHEIGRENFVKEVWKWKEKYGNTIYDQLRTLGVSLDWSRQTFTMDTKHTNAVNTAFIRLFQKGLIYRKKALVNWCNALKSTVSDIEVDNISINEPKDIVLPGYDKPVKFGLIYNFAYKIYDSNEEIVVSTTMPETMLGDTAIAIHPSDNRYKHLVGKKAVHPFRENTIPIIADDFVDMDFGTGAVKITPAHSKVDYDIGKHHHLPLLQVIGEDGRIINSGKFDKLHRYECRQVLVQTLDNLGLLKQVNPHQMTLPTCSRTGDVIEYLPKEQWFLSCSQLNEKASEYVKNGKLRIEPEKFIKTWLHWTSDDRDWCISRQLWWGHQIPAYKCSVEKDVIWIAASDEAAAKIQASKYLRTLPDSIVTERDTDVLDTWFSSGIYPFASLGWPDHHENEDYKRFYPLSLMATGHDILGFWVNRMVILGLELTGKLPFSNVLLHGIICDTKGAKMSKSKGNVIDPIDIINGISMEKLKEKAEDMHKQGVLTKDEVKKALDYHKTNFSGAKGIPECGVDALRFTLLSQDIKSHFVSFDVYQCHANKLFCNKIWQSIKYMQLSYAKLKVYEGSITQEDLTHFDKWILSRLSNMVEIVNRSMDAYDFHLATKALRTFIYNEFCDIYLEATKPGFDDNVKMGYAHAHTLSAVLNTSLRSLAPFMVYITDELIPKIPAFENNIIYNFNDATCKYLEFPKTEDFEIWKNESLEKQTNRLLGAINLVRELKGLYNISNKSKPSISVKTLDESLVNDIENIKPVVLHLTRCSDLVYKKDHNKNYVRGILDKDTELFIEIVGDNIENTILSARNRLEKKIKKIEESLSKLEEKCSSTHYLNTVPEWTQILDREKLLTKKQELQHLQRLI